MAINVKIESSRFGVTIQAAYVRVVTVVESRTTDPDSRFNIMIDFVPYMVQPTNETIEGVDLRRVHVAQAELLAHPGASYVEKAYKVLMALPEFAGAEAV